MAYEARREARSLQKLQFKKTRSGAFPQEKDPEKSFSCSVQAGASTEIEYRFSRETEQVTKHEVKSFFASMSGLAIVWR